MKKQVQGLGWERSTFILQKSRIPATFKEKELPFLLPDLPTCPIQGLESNFFHHFFTSGDLVLHIEQKKFHLESKPATNWTLQVPQWKNLEVLGKFFCVFFLSESSCLIFLYNRLVGDILLCTGFLSYLGPFNQIFRNYLLKDQWELEMRARKIPFTENLNLISMLVDPPTVSLLLYFNFSLNLFLIPK